MDTYLKQLNASEAESARIVQEVLEDGSIYHFGRLIESPEVVKLSESEEYLPYWRLLEVFAYGTLSDYKGIASQLPEITSRQLEKLKHLTLVSFASGAKILPYDEVMRVLSCENEQQMEDLVIETIYKELISAKLDQQRRLVEVDYVVGRDVHRRDLPEMHSLLSAWSTVCEGVLASLNNSIVSANTAAITKKRDDTEFTQNLQDARVKYANVSSGAAVAGGDDSDGASHQDAQYASSEYQREEQRKAGKA
ncbi:hypothetical protein GQ54DRAFT_298084 [Martensiomyces pterosporus]|nr:hypothetical protein GQ54DRAFT_298084 [Martensiomyces pterosporus]